MRTSVGLCNGRCSDKKSVRLQGSGLSGRSLKISLPACSISLPESQKVTESTKEQTAENLTVVGETINC